ncbi:phosphoesterase [Mycobacterium sp. M1]|uniref:Phosphoesterase n=2 Tax=Mycolicibacter acidiphilus TaxID=2835306 RepID=A0ABS5RQ40_9MYCO|nr:phosphoesterase [Mycolicibacter acidiphilus]
MFNGLFNQGASGSVSAGPPMSGNLLVNPGFETADPSASGYSGVTIPGWTETGTPTVIPYGAGVGYPSPVSFPLPTASGIFGFPQAIPGGGDNFAGGGPVGTSSISQTVDVDGAGGTAYHLSADLGGQTWNPSYSTVTVTFDNANGDVVGTGSLNPVTVWDRLGFTGFQERDLTGTVPDSATSAVVTTTFTDKNDWLGNYNGAYADNESFTVGDPGLHAAPLTPPTSDVGHLDHVFLIYLENKGAQDIVGSPNAPFLNSLIKDNDYDSNYFALGHPSNPNYFRILGGSDFGIDYNSNPGSIPAGTPNLMQELDQAGLGWAGYQQGGDVDSLPFTQFQYVDGNTPAYQAEHLLPLTQLSTDLAHPSTFPAFSWIVPDEAHNGEGPVDTLGGVLKFIETQFTNHQYNVPAADAFAQQEVSAIENSPTWTDPNEKDAIIITFDEDNNNLSLGLGNQGNNVPMIVVPNAGAIADGDMQPGHFTTDDYYNEYSLMATIEDALRTTPGTLAPLTANDTYATPMNAFWK